MKMLKIKLFDDELLYPRKEPARSQLFDAEGKNNS